MMLPVIRAVRIIGTKDDRTTMEHETRTWPFVKVRERVATLLAAGGRNSTDIGIMVSFQLLASTGTRKQRIRSSQTSFRL